MKLPQLDLEVTGMKVWPLFAMAWMAWSVRFVYRECRRDRKAAKLWAFIISTLLVFGTLALIGGLRGWW